MKKAFVSLLICVLATACAAGRSKYADEMNLMIGNADKERVVAKYGPPDKHIALNGATEVWEYRLNEQKYTSPTGYRFSTFDRLRLTFKEGVLSNWNSEYITE